MAENDAAGKSWWGTMPGVLTALAGIITAVGGLVAILAQSGLVGSKAERAASAAEKAAVAAQPTPTLAAAPDLPAPAPAAVAAATKPAALQPGAAPAAAVLHSPAEVLAGLRAVGFKGLAVLHKDGTVVSLAPGAEIMGQALALTNGQSVAFERMVSIDIEQPWDGVATLTLTNGQRLAAKLNDYNLYGKNELGAYRELLSNLKRIEFVR